MRNVVTECARLRKEHGGPDYLTLYSFSMENWKRPVNEVSFLMQMYIDYLRSDAKYTVVAWRDGGSPAEAVVRTPLKELVDQLDAEEFAQVHRSVVVNLRAISHVKRHDNETAEIHLKGRKDVLPVSRSYLHLFRQM